MRLLRRPLRFIAVALLLLITNDICAQNKGKRPTQKKTVAGHTVVKTSSSKTTETKSETTDSDKVLPETSIPVAIDFTPMIELSDDEIVKRVYKANPYTLYKKGSVAEYAFSDGDDQEPLLYMVGKSPAYYIRQAVSDVQIVQGLYQAMVLQSYYDQSGARITDKRTESVEQFYPTEIDTKGVFHLTHDIMNDLFYNVKSRSGYAFLLPTSFSKDVLLDGFTITDNVRIKNISNKTITTNYNNVRYQGHEKVTTPAGTFDCVKIIYDYRSSFRHVGENVCSYKATIWLARGIGLVKAVCANRSVTGKSDFVFAPPAVIYLNQLLLK